MFNSSTNKFLVISIAALILSVSIHGYLLLVISDQGGELLNTMQLIEDDRLAHQTNQDTLSAFDGSSEDRSQIESFIIKDDEDTSSLLSLVEKVAVEQDIVLTTERLKVVETEEGKFDDLSVTFDLEGSAENVMRMVSIIETLPYKQRVVELNIKERTDVNTGTTVAAAKIDIIFSLKKGNI